MKLIAFSLALLMGGESFAAAMGLERWRRSDLGIETVAEPIHVNGVPIVISRAVGSGVAAAVETIRKQWVHEVGVAGVQTDTRLEWTVMSRLHEGNLEVIQWRAAGLEPEMLWSKMELSVGIRSAPRTQLTLPRGCIPGRTVHGNVKEGVYLQQTARCATSAAAILSSMSASAIRKGYFVRTLDRMLVAHKRGMEVVVVAGKGVDPRSSGSSLVYLQVDRGRGVP